MEKQEKKYDTITSYQSIFTKWKWLFALGTSFCLLQSSHGGVPANT